MAPSVTSAGDDVIATWIEPARGGARRVRFATLRAATRRWDTPSTVRESAKLVANWADFPVPIRALSGRYYVALLEQGRSREAYSVELASSRDGVVWSPAGVLHDDGTDTEHGFVSLVPEGRDVRAVWLDGRAIANGGPMSIRSAVIGPDDAITEQAVIDSRVCDCCQTTMVQTPRGPVVAYRDRSDAELRDIAVVRRVDGAWSEPRSARADGWTIAGCPVNGPQASALGARVALAWYTEADAGPRVSVAFSQDAGDRFGAPIVVGAARPLGRVDVEWTAAGDALVSWLAAGTRDGEAIVRLRRAAPDGRAGAAVDVARTGAARASGFPRIARLGEDMLVTWTDVGPPTRVRAALVDPSEVPAPSGTRAALRVEPVEAALTLGETLPDVPLVDLDGQAMRLASLRGKPLVLSFFATWCAACREEFSLLSRIARDHGDRVHVVGVSLDDGTTDDVARFARTHGLAYAVLHDREDRAAAAFGVPPLPATFVFDARGVLVYRRTGGGPVLERELSTAVISALR